MSEPVLKAVATITDPDSATKDDPNGGFTAVLSTPSEDRDGDRLLRDEWAEPLPKRINLDVDHEMTVQGTIGSARPYFDDDGRLMIDATFSSIPKAQEVRTLVREGHVDSVSVAFMTDRSKKDGVPRRELLNAGVVAIPSNRDAVILSAKEFAALRGDEIEVKADGIAYADPGYLDSEGKPAKDGNGQPRYKIDNEAHTRAAWSYINMPKNADQYTAAQLAKIKDKIKAAASKFGIEISEDSKSAAGIAAFVDGVPVTNTHVAVGGGGGGAHSIVFDSKAGARNSASDTKMIQAIHDASSLLGAECASEAAPDPGSGADEGANKSAWRAMIVGKALAGSVEDLRDRLSDAVQDVAGDDCWIWVRATFLDAGGNSGTVVYDLGEETYSRTFSDEDGLISLGSSLECVTFVTSVAPASTQVDDDPSDAVDGAADEHDGDDAEKSCDVPDLTAFSRALETLTKSSGSASPESSEPAEPPAAPSGPAAGEAAEEVEEAHEVRIRDLRLQMLADDAKRASVS